MVLASPIQKISRMSKYLVVLGGPTAAGKTATSIELAKHFNRDHFSRFQTDLQGNMHWYRGT